jgi:hypothetical protein
LIRRPLPQAVFVLDGCLQGEQQRAGGTCRSHSTSLLALPGYPCTRAPAGARPRRSPTAPAACTAVRCSRPRRRWRR